jgi:hypothetical protein
MEKLKEIKRIDLMHGSAILISIEMKARQTVQTIRWRNAVLLIVVMNRSIINKKIAILTKLEAFTYSQD